MIVEKMPWIVKKNKLIGIMFDTLAENITYEIKNSLIRVSYFLIFLHQRILSQMTNVYESNKK